MGTGKSIWGRNLAGGIGGGITLALLTLAIAAVPAQGYAVLGPNSHDFGNQTVGTSSSAFSFTLNAKCATQPFAPYDCITPGGEPDFVPNVSVTAGYSQTNNCPASMPANNGVGSFCTINVTFAPLAAGLNSGTLYSNAGQAGAPRSALYGTGVAVPIAAPPTSLPVGQLTKCKKKKTKAARKKCRRKLRR